MDDDFIKKDGYKFSFKPSACDYCGGRCCYGDSGYIWVTEQDMVAISDYCKIEYSEFIKDYVRIEHNKYTLKDLKYDGYYFCVFFDIDKRQCSIYPVRPKQCISFPFWDIYKDDPEPLFTECPGVEELIRNS